MSIGLHCVGSSNRAAEVAVTRSRGVALSGEGPHPPRGDSGDEGDVEDDTDAAGVITPSRITAPIPEPPRVQALRFWASLASKSRLREALWLWWTSASPPPPETLLWRL